MSILDVLLAAIIATGAGFVQGSIGLGFAILGVPVLTLVDPAFTPVPVILTTIPLTGAMAWRERDHIEWGRVGWVLVGRLPGALLGLWLLRTASERSLALVIGSVVLAVVVALALGVRVRRSPGADFVGGVTSGASGLATGIGGPPLAILFAGTEGPLLRSTLAAIFFVGIAINVATLAIGGEVTTESFLFAAPLFPAMLLGLRLSRSVIHRIDVSRLRSLVLIIAALAAVILLARTVSAP